MPLEGVEELALSTPELDGFVPTSGGKRLAVRAKADALDPSIMPL